jgi:hypothetical protein
MVRKVQSMVGRTVLEQSMVGRTVLVQSMVGRTVLLGILHQLMHGFQIL